MEENPFPDKPVDSEEEEALTSSEENFSLSDFNTAAVFGDSLLPYIPKQNSQQSQQQDLSGQFSVIEESYSMIRESSLPEITPRTKAENQATADKYCPTDGQIYDEDNINYCLLCGSLLVFRDPVQKFVPDESQPITETNFLPNSHPSEDEKKQIGSTSTELPPQTKICWNCKAVNGLENAFCDNCGMAFTVPNLNWKPAPTLPEMVDPSPTVILPADSPNDGKSQNPFRYMPSKRYEKGEILANTYKIKEFIGQGGFSDIYAVEDTRKYFADVQVLKLVYQNITENFSKPSAEDLRDSYRSQYKAWKIISEKEPDHIVRFHDVEIVVGRVGLLMEFMKGGTLLDLVESWGGKPQTQEQLQHLVKLFIQAARGLHALHKYKLIHRDVKPQNFLLDAAREKCKLCDFELLDKKDEDVKEIFAEAFSTNIDNSIVGTVLFMSPEAFEGKSSIKSDIFSLGVMFYFLLSGKYPFAEGAIDILEVVFAHKKKERPKSLTDHNSLVSSSLDQLVQWCLEVEPNQRPDSLADLIHRFLQLGISDEDSNFSPANLAQLLLKHLEPLDRKWLIRHLELRKFRSMSILPEFQQEDMIEEYCYTTSPYEILEKHCAGASLYAVADALKINLEEFESREDLIKEIVKALGFLEGKKQTRGLETIRRRLENFRIDFESAETFIECRGQLDLTFAEIERAVSLLISFYGQMFHGEGLNNFISKKIKSKPADKLTFGEKVGVLRDLSTQKPNAPLPERVERIFKFPIMVEDIFEKLGIVVKLRNQVVHNRAEFNNLHDIQVFGQRILQTAVEIVQNLISNPYTPRVVQITSLQNDIYGRHFYEGQDEKGKKEKIFTTHGLHVGQLYWFVPLTNPARINPLIFPFDESEVKK